MKTFEDYCRDVFTWEGWGDYVSGRNTAQHAEHVAGDHGSYTKLGITIFDLTDWRVEHGLPPATPEDVDALTVDQAIEIYRAKFFLRPHFDRLPQSIQEEVFDIGVVSGVGRAVRILQRVVGVQADGICGPATEAAAQKAVAERGANGVLNELINAREAYYDAIVESHPDQVKFARGWHNRAEKLRPVAA